MTTFSVVATPIGNLEDITLRALNVLRRADLILCEDTRVTKRLLARHGIHVKTMSYHTHSKLSRTEEIISLLKESCQPNRSAHIVLVSDAGTPGISDPGTELVRHIRGELVEEIKSGLLKIEAIPGPSALTAALSIAGVPCAEFTFLGFLPHKKGRETLFKEIIESKRTVVFYESPHRILKTLKALKEYKVESKKEDVLAVIPAKAGIQDQTNDQCSITNNQSKHITVCRELTKVFEEVVSGTAEEVLEYFTAHSDKVRGEFVIIVSTKKPVPNYMIKKPLPQLR